jgi:hypothetical protein
MCSQVSCEVVLFCMTRHWFSSVDLPTHFEANAHRHFQKFAKATILNARTSMVGR